MPGPFPPIDPPRRPRHARVVLYLGPGFPAQHAALLHVDPWFYQSAQTFYSWLSYVEHRVEEEMGLPCGAIDELRRTWIAHPPVEPVPPLIPSTITNEECWCDVGAPA